VKGGGRKRPARISASAHARAIAPSHARRGELGRARAMVREAPYGASDIVGAQVLRGHACICGPGDLTCKVGSSGSSSSSLVGCQGRSQLFPLLSRKTSSSSLLAVPLLHVGSPPPYQNRNEDTAAHAAQPQCAGWSGCNAAQRSGGAPSSSAPGSARITTAVVFARVPRIVVPAAVQPQRPRRPEQRQPVRRHANRGTPAHRKARGRRRTREQQKAGGGRRCDPMPHQGHRQRW